MAWMVKYQRFGNFLRKRVAVVGGGVSFLGRLRIIVGMAIALATILAFTVFSRDNVGVNVPQHLDTKTRTQFASPDFISMSCFVRDTVYSVPCNGKLIRVEIKVSKNANSENPRKMLLLLPGWNFSDTQWCTRTQVCDEASRRGYDVMLVEMGKSVYMDSLYPQMRADYRLHPTRTWLWDSVLKPLQQRGYFTQKGQPEDPTTTSNGRVIYKSMRLPIPSFVMGLSTGARGALLLALEHPEAFKGCAGLSGDYNPLLMKNDNLMINCLGKYDVVPWRWSGTNNIVKRVDSLKVPVYLAHGAKDIVVSSKQTESLIWSIHQSTSCRDKMAVFAKSHGKVGFVRSLIFRDGIHDYVFWNMAGLSALTYFDELLQQ